MLIKQQALSSHLHKKLGAIYIIFGQDFFLLNEAAESLKKTWKITNEEVEESIITINNSSDWTVIKEEANSYSLFSKATLIDIRYEKKTLEAAAKAFLVGYLQNINPSCLLILRAPNLPLKQLQTLANQDNLHLVQAIPLPELALQQWIREQFKKRELKCEPGVPVLIQQYTQGNMLACAQVIEKLGLIAEVDTLLTIETVKDQLVNQCDYQLFELADACLTQNSEKVIQLIRHASHTKVEPSLILWLLAQEVRLLLQLKELTIKQALPFNAACSQLKIWPQRARLYQSCLDLIDLTTLVNLLQFCKTIDERIKSTQSNQIWQGLEQIALSLSLRKKVGILA